jgi:CheY-like chemotaxis protein
VVVIEDDPDVRDLLATILEGSGYAVTATANGRDGLEAVRREEPDVITWTWHCPTSTAWSCAG